MVYRPDIDGLRAIAVLSITLYHFGLRQFSGGFVGVDVFFVISGYLITKLIVNDLEADQFSLATFFARRIRRLAPALIVTISLTLVAGYYVLVPGHFDELGEGAIAALFFVSNILFWSLSGYFDTAAIYKPLLHTWSLAVEEQFYLVWPATLLLLWSRFTRQWLLLIVAVAAAVSLGAAIWAARVQPEAGFFLTPFRIYEFAIGAALALCGFTASRVLTGNLAALAGLILIAYAVLTFNSQMAFPSANALVPCIGTALVIYGARTGVVGTMLSAWPLRSIGRISYSLYLVHWPLVVFYAYIFGPPGDPYTTFVLTITALVLSTLLYWLVEKPFRARRNDAFIMSTRIAMTTIAACAVVLAGVASRTAEIGVHQVRESPEMASLNSEIRQGQRARRDAIRRDSCHFNTDIADGFEERFADCHAGIDDDIVVLVGDSHAADIYMGLRQIYPAANIMQITGAGCEFSRQQSFRRCAPVFEPAQTWMATNAHRIKAVIYSQRGANFFNDRENSQMGLNPDRFIDLYDNLTNTVPDGVPLFVWGPRMEYSPVMRVALTQHETKDQLRDFYHQTSTEVFWAADVALASTFAGRASYISTMDLLCDRNCPIYLPTGQAMFLDSAHWSMKSAAYVVREAIKAYPSLAAVFNEY